MTTTTTTTTTRRMIAALMAVGALTVAAPGVAHAGESCHPINATGTGQATSPTTTVATIREGGLLTGTTTGAFAVTGVTPTGFLIAGTVAFTVNRATLDVAVAGNVDPVGTGGALTFAVTSTGMSGTGRLAGTTGTLSFVGEGADDGSFTEDVTGRICVDLAPRS